MVQRSVVSSSSPAWGAVLAVLCLICFRMKPRLHCVLRSCPRPSGSKGPTVAVVSSTLFSCAICRNLPVNPPKVTRERVRHNGDAGRRRQAAHGFQARDEGRLVDNSDVVPTTIRRVSKQWTGLVLTTPCRNKFSGAGALQRSPAALLVLRLHQRRVLCAFLAQFVTWRRPAHPGMEYRSQ